MKRTSPDGSRVGIPRTQSKILAFFRERADAGAPPPTLREVAKRFGWASSTAASYHIKLLVEAGLLAHSPGKSRAARLADVDSVKVPFALLDGEFVKPDSFLAIAVPKQLLPPARRPFIVQATEANPSSHVQEGDLLILRSDRVAAPSDLVAIRVRDGVRVDRADTLESTQGPRTLGVLTGVMRYYPQPEDDA